jgi:hypothetical protein
MCAGGGGSLSRSLEFFNDEHNRLSCEARFNRVVTAAADMSTFVIAFFAF